MKRIISVLLCLVVLVMSLAACGNKDDLEGVGVTEETEPAPEVLTLVSGGVSQYEIIYPESCTSEASNFVNSFRRLFKEKTGIMLPQTGDFVKNGEDHENDTFKIFIGETNYSGSQTAYTDLKYRDFKVIAKGTNIVVAAHTNTGYDEAIRWFKKNLFENYTGGDLVMQATDVEISQVDYPIDNWTINDNPIKMYQIIYSSEDTGIVEKVAEFQKQLADASGWLLKAGSDAEMPESDYEILIGDTNRSATKYVEDPLALNYIVKVKDNKLVFKYGGAHTRELVLTELVEILTNGSSTVEMNGSYVLRGNLYDDPYDTTLAAGADLRIMCVNLMANLSNYDCGAAKSGFAFERRAEIFNAHIDYYQPTVIGFQEADMSWYDAIDAYYNIDNWEVIKVTNPHVDDPEYTFSSLMWRKDLYNLVDSDVILYEMNNNQRCRWYAWAILEEKATGQQFCVVSTHWDGADTENTMKQEEELAAFVNNIADTKNIPVFTMGDFNSNEWSEAWKKYFPEIDSYDCMRANDALRVNKEDAWHGWGVADEVVGGSGDHITATKSNVEILRFETLIYLEQIWASDHSWLLCDFRFKE